MTPSKHRAGQALDDWHRQRDALSRQWPSLLRALPPKVVLVERGGGIGLTPAAVVLHRDWLKQASPAELQQALLHLSAHAALGHRPWRWHPAALDAQLDAAANAFLRALGVRELMSQWQADHHGTWPNLPIQQPGDSLMARAAAHKPPPNPTPPPAESQTENTAPPPAETGTQAKDLPDFDAQQAKQARPQSQIGLAHRAGTAPAAPSSPKVAGIPWQSVLPIWLSQRAYQRWQFNRPARRQAAPFIVPRLGGRQLQVVLAIDISGSIAPEWIGQFLNEIDRLRSQISLQLRLITCDNRIHRDERLFGITRWTAVQGGGGTDFRPVFERLQGDAAVDGLIYCTDLAGQFPLQAPRFPVFWLVPHSLGQPMSGSPIGLKPPPFGQVLTP
ncbi:MAG TPA: VWA-like domain-containing protein [Halothiobacillus sp.]|nr:VWA-like domain-containing protein [Halothiobacillus sp.]